MTSRTLTESLRETLALFDGHGPPRTTSEVAEQLDLGRRSAYERLDRLVEHGELESKKVGASARVWWRPPPADDQSPDRRSRPVGTGSPIDGVLEGAGVGAFVFDENAELAWMNDAAERYFGLDRDRVLGRDERTLIEEFLAPAVEDGSPLVDALPADPDDPSAERVECRVVAGEGRETRRIERHTEPIESGTYAGGRVDFYRDVTERTHPKRPRLHDRGEFEALVEHFPNGAVALVDDDLRYVTFGGVLAGNADVNRDDLEGSYLRDALPEELANVVVPGYEAALDGEIVRVESAIDDDVYQFHFVPVRGDGGVVAALGMSQDVTDRKARERELERQREQLTALNNLNDVVRSIIDEVVDRSTREEIERVVCEHLAATESYLFAWIGDVDVASQTVNLRTEAGVEGYLEGITISVDPDDERSRGPTGRAILRREIQTTQDIRADSRHDPWRSHNEEYGFRSSAAIPIVHEDTVYGVLNVYAERPSAFEGPERAVIDQLGEVVGHAISATERKRALMSDEVVELQFRIRDLFDAFDVDVSPAGTAALEHAVPIGDDEYLVYGNATADAVDGLEALVDAIPHWVDVELQDDSGATDFELRLSEPPVLSTVTSLGGTIQNAAVADGDLRMTLHLVPGADIRRVIDAVEAAYPDAELLSHRQIARPDTAAARVRHVLTDDLTDRQRSALEAAYHAGFYEWPRAASGEDVADSLGVAPPTFHQHLRKAQRKVFCSLLSTSATQQSAEGASRSSTERAGSTDG